MAEVTADAKYAFLDSLGRKAAALSVRLVDCINSGLDSAVSGVTELNGLVQIGVSGNGSSVTMQMPTDLPPSRYVGFWGRLKKDHVDAAAKLVAAGTVEANLTDAQILAEMQRKCVPIRSFHTDFSMLSR